MNLRGGWTRFWNAISASVGTGFVGAIAVLGVIIIVGGLIKWLWDRHKSGKSASFPTVLVVVGAILAGPNLLLPVFLGILDTVVDAGKSVLDLFA